MLALLIMPDDERANRITAALRAEDIELCRAAGGAEGLVRVRERAAGRGYTHFDIALLDAALPDMTAEEIQVALAAATPQTPVIRLADLSTGDDDALLIALYRALGRQRPLAYVVAAGPFSLVFKGARLRIDGERVYLSAKEVQLLELLARRRGEVVGQEELFRHLFPDHDEVLTKALDVYVTRARKILRGPARGHNFIKTVWGEGFTFGEPEDVG